MPDPFLPWLVHLMAGGALGLFSAGLTTALGMRWADRLPGESRVPECFYCLQPFIWSDVFPLLGWLLRPGPLRFPCPCGRRTGFWAQPLAELLGFLLGATAIGIMGWSWGALLACVGLGLLPAIALVDLSFGIIPDELNIFLGLTGLALAFLQGDLFLALMTSAALLALGLALAFGYSKWRGREMLGLGDVKFFAAAGLWLPPMLAPWFLGVSGIFGVILGLLWRRAHPGNKEFPFGPALCLALALGVLGKPFLSF